MIIYQMYAFVLLNYRPYLNLINNGLNCINKAYGASLLLCNYQNEKNGT